MSQLLARTGMPWFATEGAPPTDRLRALATEVTEATEAASPRAQEGRPGPLDGGTR